MDDDNVELTLYRRTDKTYYWELKVICEVRPTIRSVGTLEHQPTNQRQHLGVLGGTMAEELCEKYSDTLDPTTVAKAVMELYDELVDTPLMPEVGEELPRAAIISPGSMARN